MKQSIAIIVASFGSTHQHAIQNSIAGEFPRGLGESAAVQEMYASGVREAMMRLR